MPLALDPEATFDFWLESDKDKPAERRPTFIFKHLSLRQTRAAAGPIDAVSTTADTGGTIAALCDGVRAGLVGWRGMTGRDGNDIPYDPARLDEIITAREAWELWFGAATGRSPNEADLKNSESPSHSSSANSAKGAGQAGTAAEDTSQNDA